MKNISFIFILLFCSFLMGSAYAEDVSGDADPISTDNNNQQVFTTNATSLTITNSATLTRTGQNGININAKNNEL